MVGFQVYFESKTTRIANRLDVQVREKSRMMPRFLAQITGKIVISFTDLGNTIRI